MGHVVGKVMVDHGLKVLTCLADRSERTRGLAAAGGIEDTSSYEALVEQVDLMVSIMVPAEAMGAATRVAEALKSTVSTLTYVDCNAIAPETVRHMADIVTAAGARFVDAGIIGGPPRKPGGTRLYASGEHAADFAVLNDYGLEVPVIGEEIGQASGLKMCYAALTKGTSAVMIELLTGAKRMGLFDSLIGELEKSQPGRLEMMQGLTNVPNRSRRWIGEMEEIAKTFGDLGLTPKIYEGAADIYRLVGGTELADETPETRDKDRTLDQLVEVVAKE
tara:strand:- start:1245 stop:2075 length:831 start_codon:yes stop_codon:yes gene_type:complete